jgi:UDP-N-acetylglucosamine 2-epimerase (non-hydrolysing)
MRIASIFGTRPEIIKLAPLIPLMDRQFDHALINTTQHYEYLMSEIFFEELGVRQPDRSLELGDEVDIHSPSSVRKMSLMLIALDQILPKLKPDLCLVLGDTDSTLAGALVSSKHHIPIIHVEAGLRSFDMSMPEEVVRVIVDNISSVLFTPSDLATRNLNMGGISENIYKVGNTIVDICLSFRDKVANLKLCEKLNLERKGYAVLTIHREANTEDEKLKQIFEAILRLDVPIAFPIHPRTKRRLSNMGLLEHLLKKDGLRMTDPLGYGEFLSLMADSRLILTDSGGIQEEAITLKVPCLTLRDNTERWETVHLGANRLIGTHPERIVEETRKAWVDEEWMERIKGIENPYGDGKASERIVSKLEEIGPSLRLESKEKLAMKTNSFS